MKTLLLTLSLLAGSALALAQDPVEALTLHLPVDEHGRETPGAERLARFEALMTTLGSRPAPPDADEGVGAEIVRVARDRAAHPERVEALVAFYVKQWDTTSRIHTAVPPQPQHLGAAYRYAWEYLYLRPSLGRTEAPGYGWRAAEALAKMHDDASLPLVVAGFELQTARIWDGSIRDQTQADAIGKLSQYVSERGLDALLRCATDMRASQRDTEPVLRTNVAALVYERLHATHPAGRAEAWATVVEAYRRNPAHASRLPTLRLLLDDPAKPHP